MDGIDFIYKWILPFLGLLMINYFPLLINEWYSGVLLSLGIIFFVEGAICSWM